MLRSLYINLLDQIESHTLAVLPVGDQSLPDYIGRHCLQEAIVNAVNLGVRDLALRLITEHNTSSATSPLS